MKTLEWIRFLDAQKAQHGKALFRVAELANVAGRSGGALNVELTRLVKKGVLACYSSGVYGLPGSATPEDLVATLDTGAYITGMFALYRHNLITQAPTQITCFSNRRHNRSRWRKTPLGAMEFVCVTRRIYDKPAGGAIAGPEQAFCDFVHTAKRQGLNPATLVTFRNLNRLKPKQLADIAARYPSTTRETIRRLAVMG